MNKFIDVWNKTEKLTVGILSLAAVLFAFSGVIARYFFSYSPEWLEETVIYIVIWSVFLVSSSLVEERRHVGATFFMEMLPLKLQRIIDTLTSLMASVFCVLIFFWGSQIVHLSYITDERSTTSMRYPLWIFYLALPVGMGLMSARYLKRFYRLLFQFTPTELIAEHEMSRASLKQQGPISNPPDNKVNPS